MLSLLNIKKISTSQKKELIKLFSKKVDNYTTSITFLTVNEQKNFIKRCKEIKTYGSYEIDVDYKDYNIFTKKILLLFILQKNKQKKIL